MNAERPLHGPTIVIVNCFVGWECRCGGAWPCPILRRIEDRRRAREAWSRDYEEIALGEFWSRE